MTGFRLAHFTVAILLALVALAITALPATAGAAPAWAPASEATIHPGVQTETKGSGQCTSNFIFTRGTDTYIGQAAHCSGTGAATETDGCDAASLPLGTKVEIEGASRPGSLDYNSWLAMQAAGESRPEACAYNDFALVKIDPADVDKVNPSIPSFGGPTGVGTSSTGEQVYTYGNSSLRMGITLLSPKTGATVERTPGGWSYSVYTVTPGVPGDSGSAFLNASGQALGVLSTVAIAPLAGSNGVGDIGKELDYARSHGFDGLVLEDGTEPFMGASADPTIDATPPESTITKAPRKLKLKGTKKTAKATFEFKADDPAATLECKLDARSFAPCTSPKTVKLKKGRHTFSVRATDSLGNVEPTPATKTVKVKKAKKR